MNNLNLSNSLIQATVDFGKTKITDENINVEYARVTMVDANVKVDSSTVVVNKAALGLLIICFNRSSIIIFYSYFSMKLLQVTKGAAAAGLNPKTITFFS